MSTGFKPRYEQVIRIQRCMVDDPEHEITVKCIGGKYHVRVLVQGTVNQEAVCFHRSDIGYTAKSLLRWEDKCGTISAFASAARKRLYSKP